MQSSCASGCICVIYYKLCSPPVPVGVDAQGRTIPGEVPKLFGGELVKYIMVRRWILCQQILTCHLV